MDEKPKITHSVNKEFQKAAGQYESNVPNKELVESSEKEETMENSVDAAASESLFSKIKAFLTSMAGAVIKKLSESKNEPKQTIDGDNGTNINDDISDNNNKVNRSKNSVNSEGDNAKIGDNNIDGDNNHVDNSKGSINIKSIGQGITTIINQPRITIAAFAGMVLIVLLFQLPDIINSFIKPNTNEKQPFIVQTTISTSFTPPLTTTEPSENTTFLTTTTTPDLTTVLPETTQTTTTTPVATTTSRPVQTTQSSYIPPPPPTTPQHTESAITPPETLPPETTVATTTTPGVGVENGFAYSLENGQAIVTGYYGTETVVRIPDYLAGSPVSIIDKGAFADKTFISGIQFPCTLIKIEENAFAGCCNLMDVQIPASVTDIGAYAFINSAGGELSFPNGTQMTVIVENAFYGSLVQKVHIPEGVIEIKESAFRDCSELVDIVLPVSLEYIGNYAFFNSNPIERKLQYCGTADKWAGLVKDKTIYNSATVPSCNYGKNPL